MIFRTRYRRWIRVIVLLLAPLTYILQLGRSGMVAYASSPIAWTGVSLSVVGLLLPAIGKIYRQHSNRQDRAVDLVFALIFVFVGGFLFVRGWRLDLESQLVYLLLIESTLYWVVKDIFYR